jgi:hypothetical protein
MDQERGLGGITEQEFRNLFKQCSRCRLVMTARIFAFHRCAIPAVQVIDLTDEAI